MRERVKTVRLWQMVYLGKGAPVVRQVIHAIIAIALRLFFRRIEVVGVERVPQTGPLLFVLNHPNGLVDPGLVFVSLPRRVSFLAKSTLFDNPVGAFVLRTFEILPVYRRIDAGAKLENNLTTFESCFEMLRRGRCIAIFPEGISHDEPKLLNLKTGAARIALEAVSRPEPAKGLRIVPVGLFYTSKTSFRSEVLIRYGDIFAVEPVELDAKGEPPREAVANLTSQIEQHLRAVTLNVETKAVLEDVLKAEALFASFYENLIFKQTLTQTFTRLQEIAAKYKLLERQEPRRMAELNIRLRRFEQNLKASGLSADSLSVLQHPTSYVLRYLVLRILLLIIFAPLAIPGAIIHSPAFLFSTLLGRIFNMHDADVAGSSSSIIAAMVLMPLTWVVVASVLWYVFGWQIGVASVPITILCGYVALRSFEMLVDMRTWVKAIWILFRDRALFLRLLIRRRYLQREIGELVDE